MCLPVSQDKPHTHQHATVSTSQSFESVWGGSTSLQGVRVAALWASSCLCSPLKRDTQPRNKPRWWQWPCLCSALAYGGVEIPEDHTWWLAEVVHQRRGSPTETPSGTAANKDIFSAFYPSLNSLLFPHMTPPTPPIWSCYSVNVACHICFLGLGLSLFLSSYPHVILNCGSVLFCHGGNRGWSVGRCCCNAGLILGRSSEVANLKSSGTSLKWSRFFRMSYNMWNKSVSVKQECYIPTRMETNAGRRGGLSSWIAIIQHQRLTLATEIAISCQLTGLCQWLWLCGDSEGEPAKPAHCILAERVSTSKNTDADGKSARLLSTRSPSHEVITEEKARLQSRKKGTGW